MNKMSVLMSVRERKFGLEGRPSDRLFLVSVDRDDNDAWVKFLKFLRNGDVRHRVDMRTVKWIGTQRNVVVNNEDGVVEIDATNNSGGYDLSVIKDAS